MLLLLAQEQLIHVQNTETFQKTRRKKNMGGDDPMFHHLEIISNNVLSH